MGKNNPKKEADAKLHFDPKTPHFFKIILQDTVEHGKLIFPRRFIRMYGEKLSNAVRLRVPTGDVWEIELQRCAAAVWLEKKGWEGFASFYSLGFGHLLVFRFVEVGIPEFEVIIFDKSTLEIEYPKVRCSIEAEPSDRGRMQNQEQVIRSPKKPWRDHESPSQLKPLKKMKISPNKVSCRKLEKILKEEKGDHDRKKHASKMHPLNTKEKAEAILRAGSFWSANPFFKLVMQPSYVNSRYILCPPSQFMQTYMPKNTGEVQLVCASNGKTWTTRYFICKAKGNSSLQVRMHHGWDTFAKENQLKVGDVCVFELIKGAEGEVSFKVTIFTPQAAKSNTVDDKVALTSSLVAKSNTSRASVLPNSDPEFLYITECTSKVHEEAFQLGEKGADANP